MATSTSNDGRKGGPDLLAPAGMADSNRILSQLEHGSTPFSAPRPALQWRPGWLAIVGAVLGITFLLLAWLAYEAMLAAPAPAPTVVQRSTPPAPAPSPAEVPLPAPVPAAATIINEAPAAEPAPRAATAAAAQHKQHAPTRQAAARAAPVKPRPGAATGDSDVTLLAAIVAHGQRAEPLRDVVLRKDEEETASLLQRCRQLGLIEGMLCRARICAGRWDSDPACH